MHSPGLLMPSVALRPLIVGWEFDRLGSYRPATVQLLALPALIPCLLMFLLPRYADRNDSQKAAIKAFAKVPTADIPQ